VTLDAVRGVAALLVFAHHTRYALFVEYHALPGRRALWLPAYIVSAAGYQAVIIFFILSGFLVGGSVFRSLDQHRWSWKQYLTHRFVRLWLVLLPALALGAIWDTLHFFLVHHSASYGGAVSQRLLEPGVEKTLTLPIFIANALFLQQIPLHPVFLHLFHIHRSTFPVFGTNGALWSLSNEFWYYMLFPLALFAIRKGKKAAHRVLSALLFLLVAWFVGKDILLLFPMWLCGVLLLFLPRRNLSHSIRILATSAYIAGFIGCILWWFQHPTLSDILLCLITTAFLWVLLSARQRATGGLAERLARGSASFSYSLYLVHMPMLYLLTGFLVHDALWTPSISKVLITLALMAVVTGYAWLIASWTEFRMDTIRGWVEGKLRRF